MLQKTSASGKDNKLVYSEFKEKNVDLGFSEYNQRKKLLSHKMNIQTYIFVVVQFILYLPDNN